MTRRESAEARARRHEEKRFEVTVKRYLTRNFAAHLAHGLLGQTGFRLLNAPTFLPAYIALLSGGSDIAVGAALALQSLGMAVTPLIGANLIAHRKRVLPIAFASGFLMRLCVLLIALAGFLLPPDTALVAIYLCLLGFGLFSGMQGVIFNFLVAKVIPVGKRGRLTGLRNFLAGLTAAAVALLAGEWFLGEAPTATGYSQTFTLAFVLTMLGLATLVFMREPVPPTRAPKQSLAGRLKGVPALLADDPAFARYFVARALATMGRMALPFYILYAGSAMALTGTNLALVTVAFTLAGTVSNLLWGSLGDRYGFRLVFLVAVGVWLGATLALVVTTGLWASVVVFAFIGAAAQGFQHASVNLTLEFGHRHDLPMRIAIANTAAELAGALGPLAGGLLAYALGYGAVFAASSAFLVIGGAIVALSVAEPRTARR